MRAVRLDQSSTLSIRPIGGLADTTEAVAGAAGLKTVSHPYSIGNGAAVKTGARVATGDILVFMDADGQHDPDDIPRLLAKIDEGYEMAIGARSRDTHASLDRQLANRFYNRLASWMTVFFIDSLLIFLIGILSEQISALHYKGVEDDQHRTRRD